MKAAWIIVAAAALSFGQTTAKKETAPATKKSTVSAAKPDTWQKSKECAAQAEKLVAEWERDGLAKGFPKVIWTNHYSPKYNRCFIEAFFDPSTRVSSLIDAFERSTLASCDFANEYCTIDIEKVDCVKVYDFIKEHMKN